MSSSQPISECSDGAQLFLKEAGGWSGDHGCNCEGRERLDRPQVPEAVEVREEALVAEDSLSSSVGWLFALTVMQKAIGLIRSIFVCRLLSPMQLGLFGMSSALLDTALPICLLSVPAIFGRYLERYRRLGQARGFIRQSMFLCGSLLAGGLTTMWLLRATLAEYVFGDASNVALVVMVMVALVPAAIFGFSTELLVALRHSRTSSSGQFVRGVSLTLGAIGMLMFYRADVVGMLIAVILSFVMGMLFLVPRLWHAFGDLRRDGNALPFVSTWRSLAPVIVCYWFSDFTANMFFTVDRYMLLNLTAVENDEALAMVGNYESAHVLPLLISTITAMVVRIQLPYLTKEWESGRKHKVSESTNLTLKIGTLVLTVVGFLFVCVGSVAFNVLFEGRFPDGLAILPISCTFYAFCGLTTIALSYLWCAEKAAWGPIATVVGMVGNIALNWWLVPRLGIAGAAWASLVAVVVEVIAMFTLAHAAGWRPHRSTLAIAILPFVLCGGVWIAAMGITFAAGFLLSPWGLSDRERARLCAAWKPNSHH